MKVLLEGGNVEDLILNGSRAVKDELDGLLLAGLSLYLETTWLGYEEK